LRRFTTLSENLEPREVVEFLNEYFTNTVDVIFRHHGILDKYIGDAIMALFGAPLGRPDDAGNALVVANEMMTAVIAMNKQRRLSKLPEFSIGVGISTGIVVAGSIGSPKRMEYTVIGDSVNLSARLESANKSYGTSILISEHTVNDLNDRSHLREIDSIVVKGKETPVAVFESLKFYTDGGFSRMDEVADIYAQGLAQYRTMNWNAAIDAFESVLAIRPNDGPSAVQLARCHAFKGSPPPQDWNGVWVFDSK
jgi:adenylate cyclase